MADSNFRGPVTSMGPMENSPAQVEIFDGPSGLYQGNALLDPRQVPFPKDGTTQGRVAAFFNSPQIILVDAIPSALSTTSIAAAANVTSGTAMTLATTAPGGAAGVPSIASGVPIIPFGSGTVTTAALALDFGFTTGTTAAASSTVAVVDNSQFTLGQWVCIGGAGNSAKTAALLTQVQSISTTNTTTITVLPAPAGTLSNAPIGGANLWSTFYPPSTQFGPQSPSATAHSPNIAAGLLRLHNPREALARVVSISNAVSASGGTFTVAGWDIYRQPMTETITASLTTAATVYGKKAFKYIGSITPNFTDAHNYAVGVGDTFGFSLRIDEWENARFYYGGGLMVISTGVIAAVTTNPATATTGDVRGTIQVSSSGNATAIASPLAAATDGVKRLAIIASAPFQNVTYANPNNYAPLFGVTQV
jgi:hypothetical protein